MSDYKDGYWATAKAGVSYVNHRSIVPSLSSYHPEGLGKNYPVKFIYDEKKNTYAVALGGLWNGTAQAIMANSEFKVIDPNGIFISNTIPLSAKLGTDVAGFKSLRVSIIAHEFDINGKPARDYTSTLAWLRDGSGEDDGDPSEIVMTSYRWRDND
ncbi:hypothetical protein [Alteromonas sp. 14N.309.X.WAT.G.H12]|uniref:hypothetical protein n=1 Tax=Alteromonas sp. 14N.309.X.WAT.G.H12 TaxID=3120824 RepID=UPI002FD06A11